MAAAKTESQSLRLPILQGILPIDRSLVSADILAGMTLAALAIPEVMGYTQDLRYAFGDSVVRAYKEAQGLRNQ